MEKTLNSKLLVRTDTEANFTTSNLLLLRGEIAISIDKGLFKVGDGVNRWGDLAYNKAASASTDGSGNTITTKYGSTFEYSGHTLTVKNAAGTSIASFDTADTTYSTGTSSTAGITKLYDTTGTNTDGTMTQDAINTALSGKAASSHTHGNADITAVDASKITTGTIDIARLPHGALERLVVVADDTARFALTTNDVQNGDTVKVTATGTMYFVVDDTSLSTAAGYEVYTAGAASSVPWSGVTDKPSTYTPSSHTHANTDVDGLDNLLLGTAGQFLKSNGSSDPTWSNVIEGGDEGYEVPSNNE